jgi:hypothetical protein
MASSRIPMCVVVISLVVGGALILPPGEVAAAPAVVDLPVRASADDAEERSSGQVSLTSGDLNLGQEDSAVQTVGLRFTGVTVPRGSTITNAYVQFETDEVKSATSSLVVRGQAADNPTTFTTATRNISSRASTAATVAWNPPSWPTVGARTAAQRTPNLAPVVQELVSRPGWGSGNAVVLIVTGTGERAAESYNSNSRRAPVLHLEYDTGAPQTPTNAAPTVNAGPDRSVEVPGPASLAGSVQDDGLPTGATVTAAWTQVSGPGTAAFADPATASTTVTFSAAGEYVLRLTGSDGQLTASDDVKVTVSSSGPIPPPPGVLDVPIRAGADDAEEAGSATDLVSSDIELAADGTRVQTVGLRFSQVPLPVGAAITRAYVQFQTDEVTTGTAQLTIAGQAADSATAFTSAAGSVSGRPRTTASVAWQPAGWSTVGARGADQRTPDLSSVVREIVSRPGWASGNALVLVITGTGTRTAEAYESGAAIAPVLHIEYGSGSGGGGTTNQPPVVDAGPAELAVTMPDAATLSGSVTDDGLPTGSSVTAAWTEVSGPGEVSFANAGAASTTATLSAAGDYVLRLTGSDGALSTTDDVLVKVAAGGGQPPPTAPAGSIYGIEPEAQSHVPPYEDGNGNLYRVTEEYYDPVPNHNTPMMMKSSDGGQTWAQVDAANRPTDRDLEGSWLLQAGTALIYVHTNGNRVTYSEFHTSDAAGTPDRWVVQNERGISGLLSDPRQWACAARTSDGRLWVFFADTTLNGRFQLSYIRRDAPGSWTPKTRISTDTESLAGATCAVDPATDVTHVFYHDYAKKQVLYRSLSPDGTLSPAVRVDTTGTSTAERNYHAVANPVVYSAGGSTVVTAMFGSASGVRALSVVDGVIAPEQVVDPAAPSISPANIGRNTGSDGPVMHLAVDGSTLHAVWAVASTGDVWHSSRPHGGQWSTPTLLVDSGAGHVSWLYSKVYPLGGQRVLGYTYDLGPHEDNAGDIRYRHVPL